VLRHTFCMAIGEREGLDVVAELAGHAEGRTSNATRTSPRRVAAARSKQAFGSGTFAGGGGER
jgi:integrase